MTDEERYDEAEQREAEALAEALERAPAQRAVAADAADALDAAELIAASRLPELSPARSEEVLHSANARIDERRKRRRRRAIGLSALAGTLAAAAAGLFVLTRPPDGPASREPVAVSSAPGANDDREAVVRAQRAWLGDPSPANRSALRQRLAQYRTAHLAELDRRLAP